MADEASTDKPQCKVTERNAHDGSVSCFFAVGNPEPAFFYEIPTMNYP